MAHTPRGPDELKEWRRARGWPQQRVADVVGLNNWQAVSHYECGRQIPSLTTALRLEELTGIDPRAWFTPAALRLTKVG